MISVAGWRRLACLAAAVAVRGQAPTQERRSRAARRRRGARARRRGSHAAPPSADATAASSGNCALQSRPGRERSAPSAVAVDAQLRADAVELDLDRPLAGQRALGRARAQQHRGDEVAGAARGAASGVTWALSLRLRPTAPSRFS